MIDADVRAEWCLWNKGFEAWIPYLYLDAHKPNPIATVGIGCALLTLRDSLALPWLRPDGTPANAADISSDWSRVTSMPGAMLAAHYQDPNGLHLDDATIERFALRRLDANVDAMTVRWPAFASFPPQAQKALASMSYALGSGDKSPGILSPMWPHLQVAVDNQDWPTAASECKMQGPGLDRRNAANFDLFMAAASA